MPQPDLHKVQSQGQVWLWLREKWSSSLTPKCSHNTTPPWGEFSPSKTWTVSMSSLGYPKVDLLYFSQCIWDMFRCSRKSNKLPRHEDLISTLQQLLIWIKLVIGFPTTLYWICIGVRLFIEAEKTNKNLCPSTSGHEVHVTRYAAGRQGASSDPLNPIHYICI